jgi:hypothetical protein
MGRHRKKPLRGRRTFLDVDGNYRAPRFLNHSLRKADVGYLCVSFAPRPRPIAG